MDILVKEMKEPSGMRPISPRVEARLAIDLPGAVTRYGAEGNASTEHTRLDDVISVGCRFRTQTELQRGDIVSVQALGRGEDNPAYEQPRLAEIIWAAPQGTGWVAGARKLAGEQLANITFPPANHSASPASK